MNPSGYVLDTSALLTLIEDEVGAERVSQVLDNEQVWLPWLVLLEAYYITLQERSRIEAETRYALMKQLPATILWNVDEPTLLTAGRLKANHRLSLADAIIAAFAIRLETTLVHKDPEFQVLADELPLENLPFNAA